MVGNITYNYSQTTTISKEDVMEKTQNWIIVGLLIVVLLLVGSIYLDVFENSIKLATIKGLVEHVYLTTEGTKYNTDQILDNSPPYTSDEPREYLGDDKQIAFWDEVLVTMLFSDIERIVYMNLPENMQADVGCPATIVVHHGNVERKINISCEDGPYATIRELE